MAESSHSEKQAEPTFSSNAVRLSLREWAVTALVIIAALCAMPWLWRRAEDFAPGPDYRVPYKLANDYWMFERLSHSAATEDKILVVGDSVIWGQYVESTGTLTHFLNETADVARYANLGVDGSHPAALAGLLRYHGGAIRDRDVILHCNLLWMSSPRHDLQETKAFRFNHPDLVPQFFPNIPCYEKSVDERLGIVIERYVPLFTWVNHLQIAYFGNAAFPPWTLEHPYGNPLTALRAELPMESPSPHENPQPWTDAGISPQNLPWIMPSDSFQWQCFMDALSTLRDRGNRITVVLGPFNEHLLTPESRERYTTLKADAAARIEAVGIECIVASLLDSELYADASHPLAAGYKQMAEDLLSQGLSTE